MAAFGRGGGKGVRGSGVDKGNCCAAGTLDGGISPDIVVIGLMVVEGSEGGLPAFLSRASSGYPREVPVDVDIGEGGKLGWRECHGEGEGEPVGERGIARRGDL